MAEDQRNNVAQEVAKEAAKEAARQAKRAAKEAIKEKAKAALAKVLASPKFWIILAIVVAVVLIIAMACYVIQKNRIESYSKRKETLTTESGFFNIGKTVFGNGVYEYEVKDDDINLMDEVIEVLGYPKDSFTRFEKYVLLKVANVTKTSNGIIKMDLDLQEYTEKELHLIPKFVEAELKTMYPDLGGSTSSYRDSFQGNVKIIRNGIQLKYKPEGEFNEAISNKNSSVLEWFTLDNAFNLIVASKSTEHVETTVTGDKGYLNDEDDTTNITYSKTSIQYISAIQKFATPYPFFFTLLTITEDENFCEEAVNKALETEIELTVYDEITTVTDVYVEEGTAKVDYKYTFHVEYDYTDYTEEEEMNIVNQRYTYSDYSEFDQIENYTLTRTTTVETTTSKIVISKANTIFWNMKQLYTNNTKSEPEVVTTGGPTTEKKNPALYVRSDMVWAGIYPSGIRGEIKDSLYGMFESSGRTVNITNIDIKASAGGISTNKDTNSYRDVYEKEITIQTRNTQNVTKKQYEEDVANSSLEFKGEGAGGFYDILINENYRDNTTEHIYELQDRLNEFFLETLNSAETYINLFEYMKAIASGQESSISIDGIMNDIMNGNELTATGSSAVTGGYIVNTTKSSEDLVLNQEQLTTAIRGWASSGTRKNNLDSVGVSKFIELQNRYNVNAVFAIAVFQQENGCGSNTNAKLIRNTTYNWGSIQGSYNGNSWIDAEGIRWCKYSNYSEATEDFMRLIRNNYFSEGRDSVQEVSEKYCPGTSEAWKSGVSAIMTEIYNAAGISLSNQTAENGDGYTTTYTNRAGMTFREYKQTAGSYSTRRIWGSGTIATNRMWAYICSNNCIRIWKHKESI